MAGAASALLSIGLMGVISTVPLIAATFVGRRMGHQGMGLIGPWIGAVVLALMIGGLIYLGASDGRERNTSPTEIAWVAGMLISGYVTTVVYLIVLAIRRLPVRPADAASVF